MEERKQAELTRIVAVRGCGHVAAFPNFAALVQGKDRCPICAAQAQAGKAGAVQTTARQAA